MICLLNMINARMKYTFVVIKPKNFQSGKGLWERKVPFSLLVKLYQHVTLVVDHAFSLLEA